MVDIESALKASLEKASSRFHAADKDVRERVLATSQSLKNLSKGKLSLALDLEDESSNGIFYTLILKADAEAFLEPIVTFKISMTGYPIQTGYMANRENVNYDESQNEFNPQSVIKDKAELEDYFGRLVSDPESELIVTASYYLSFLNTAVA